MGPLNRAEIELRQIMHRKTRDPENYFNEYFQKLLPNNLTSNDTMLLYKIDNVGCIAKIIEQNINAKYTVFGCASVNEALRLLEIPSIVKYIDSVEKFKDKKNIDYTSFTYSCFEHHPESNSPVDFLKIGLKIGDRISIIGKDDNEEYAYAFVNDNRHLVSNNMTMSIAKFFHNIYETHHGVVRITKNCYGKNVVRKDHNKWLKHGLRNRLGYIGNAMVNNSNKSIGDYREEWIDSLHVIKN